LSERLSAPLSALAEATRAIAKGDYSKLNPVKSRDEFGVLTQSFNTSTRQIADAPEGMGRNQQQLENAKTYLESILSNLTSGVLTFDERLYVKTMNTAATQIMGVAPGAVSCRALAWGSAGTTATWSCSTTSPTSSRRSATRRGERWRAGSRMRS